MNDERVRRGREYGETHPKSVCVCSHLGDGKNSQHRDGVQPGHGECTVCACTKFTWKKFTLLFERHMKKGMN